jgi:hypothetical protein
MDWEKGRTAGRSSRLALARLTDAPCDGQYHPRLYWASFPPSEQFIYLIFSRDNLNPVSVATYIQPGRVNKRRRRHV